MSCVWCGYFTLQGKLPLAGMTVTKLEDCEAHRNAFELNGKGTFYKQDVDSFLWIFINTLNNTVPVPAGTMFDRLLVICTNQQDLQDWVEHLTRQIKHTAATAPSHKPLTVPCHTVRTQWLTYPHVDHFLSIHWNPEYIDFSLTVTL